MFPSSASRVISIGAIHFDTIAHAASHIRPETSTPARHNSKPGGVATNIARTLSKLGVETGLIGVFGDDGPAQILQKQLKAEGIHLAHAIRSGFATGQYLALHNPDGQLAAACVDDKILADAPPDLFDTALDDLAVSSKQETIWFLDANLPEAMLHRLISKIGTGRLIANAVSNAKAPRLKSALKSLECLMLNRGEASAITGLPHNTVPETLVKALHEMGLRNLVLTDGSKDVIASEVGTLTRFSPPNVNVVDVTGAGDALTAGTIAALATGLKLREAVPYGLSAAAMTLQGTGALAETLTWDALGSF
ncbi:PfkB family carbohydrate kinase [Roseibium sp.]|uniref:PfkB family carbohydrate kinase n=1 Tax=Roseibium sp. TaxID=1936156 RepID=UPI0026199D40|nr:PfkB family carbohydrate kinase [Roseibium sp.]